MDSNSATLENQIYKYLTNEHLVNLQCDKSDNKDAFSIEDYSSDNDEDREHHIANRESERKLLLLLWTGYYTARPANVKSKSDVRICVHKHY